MIRLPAVFSHFFQKIPFFQPENPRLRELVNPIVLENAALTSNFWFGMIASFAVPIFREIVLPLGGRVSRWGKKKVDVPLEGVSSPTSGRLLLDGITGGIELAVGALRDGVALVAVGYSVSSGSLSSSKSFVLPILVGALSVWDLTRRFLVSRRVRKESPELSFGQRWLEKRKYLGIFPER